MKRTPIHPDLSQFPHELYPLLDGAPLFDSSCSPEARVYFIDRDGGYYLNTAPSGALSREAALTRFYHAKGLATEVLEYLSLERDWLLTARVAGEDLTSAQYLADPKRLCDTMAELLHTLHTLPAAECPFDHTAYYLATVERNFTNGQFDNSIVPPSDAPFATAIEAIATVRNGAHRLEHDTLIHGDFCLPNVMLDHWRFTGFIDLGNGGVGDRHVDLFWGAWTLFYNLGTNRYRERFFDAYGRSRIDPERLRIIAAAECFG
ncbi:MAG: aminoglycoside 3'-phosphotransferase [Clostridia bacterium]|nr:aminoglycoside 3'-phosphotransferase [Clostridia bacterium]